MDYFQVAESSNHSGGGYFENRGSGASPQHPSAAMNTPMLQRLSPRPMCHNPTSPMQAFPLASSPHRGHMLRPPMRPTNFTGQINNCRTFQNQGAPDYRMNPSPVQSRLGLQSCTPRPNEQNRVPMHHTNVPLMNMSHHGTNTNQMSTCMNHHRLGHVVSPTTCCQNYQQQPLTSPAAATPAPSIQPMFQPHQARHCNCNSQHCNPHQYCQTIQHCQNQNVHCGGHQNCTMPCNSIQMQQCNIAQPQMCNPIPQHNCMNNGYCNHQQEFNNHVFNPNSETKEEIQCGVVSQSSNNMRQAAYQRTLEYVEQCQSWAVSSSTHPASSNMVINDMTSSLNSLLEENKYFQMIQ